MDSRSCPRFTALATVFTLSLILLVPSAGIAADRLGTDVVPTFQTITLTVDANQLEYAGTTEFELKVQSQATHFDFHAEGMTLDTFELTQNDQAIATEYEVSDEGVVEVTTSSPLEPGQAHLEISFTNLLDTVNNAFYQVTDGGEHYSFTQFEPDDARNAFPCWDEPSFKIPFQMTLIVPEAHTAVFNTPIKDETVSDGQRTIAFEITKPLPTYLLAFATGPLKFVPIPGMSIPGNVVCVKGKAHLAGEAVAMTPPIVAALEKYFDQPYPYRKLDLIAVPGKGGAMENPGAITFGDGLLLLEPGMISVSQRRAFAAVTAHELAHIWFGDLVTLAWWNDTWLNESFASWMGDKITQEVFPEFGMDVSELSGALYVMNTDARPSTRAIRQPVEASDNLDLAFDDLAYSKGQAVLGMFEQWLGPDVFRKGVLDYLEEHAWGVATAHDFWAALSSASGRDIAALMAPYFDQPGVPQVSAELTLDGQVKLKQHRFANFGTTLPAEQWNIPIALKYSDGTGAKEQRVLLDQPEMTVALTGLEGKAMWVLPNADMDGYYRWSVPPDMLVALAQQTDDLTPRERVGLIGDLGALLDAGTLSGDDYLRTLNNFAHDPNPQVIAWLIQGLSKVHGAFVNEQDEEEFALYVRSTLKPALERFGMARQDGEPETVTRFRSQLLGWLGDEGQDPRVMAYADSLADVYMNDPAAVDPQLAGVALGLAAHHGNREFFEECRRRFESAETPRERSRFLSLMGDFRDPALIDEALHYTLEGPLRPGELFSIPFSIMSYRKNEDLVFNWVLDNFDAITGRIPPAYLTFMPMVASGCSRERLEKAREFFSMPEHSATGTDVQIAKVTDQVTQCADLRDREGKAVTSYLREFAAANAK